MNNSGVFAAENKLALGTDKRQGDPARKFLDLVYTEAFKRLDIIFVSTSLPAKRSSYESDKGDWLDGELSRIYSYNDIHPNLVRVEEAHWQSGFLAVAIDPSIKLDGWQSLKETDHRVNYMRGTKGCEINLPKVIRPENIETVNLMEHGFKKVLAGWADLFIGAELDIVNLLKADEFKDSGLQIVGVMEEFTAHVFLHKKHKELAQKLAAVLKEMKKEGLIDKYRNTTKLTAYFKD
ncbi:MAG: hypothetical protein ACJAUP_000366 [Cellvibrionaceae bacterium]|jgi:hypothetical protein